MTWILIFINLTTTPVTKETIGYYPDLESCQQERGALFWITPASSKAICIKNEEINKEILKTREEINADKHK